jgi:vacuolar-type H+-ATPase subunit E/Vma4
MDNSEKTKKISKQIFEDAERKGDRIISRGDRQAQKQLKEARKEAKQSKAMILEEAEENAQRMYEKILGSIPLEQKKIRLSAKDKIIQLVLSTVRQKLREEAAIDTSKILKSLTVSAISQMSADEFLISCAGKDKSIFTPHVLHQIEDEFREKESREIKLHLSENSEDIIGGVRVWDISERLFYDNSFDARLERMHEDLRQNIGKVIFQD